MSDYDYLNSRVRGMSSRLLIREFYDQVLTADGTEVLLDALLNSDYGPDLRESLTVQRGVAATESALRRNLFRTFDKVCSLAPENPRRLLNIQINRWDVANVRTIIRGKARGASEEDILAATLPVGQLDEAQLAELAGERDVVGVADSLTVWNYDFAFPLRRAIRESSQPLDLLAIETALDAVYFEWALSQLEGGDANESLLRRLVRQQIDLTNLLVALRSVTEKERGEKPESVAFIPQGRLQGPLLERVRACSKLEEALEIIETTYFAPAIEKGILAFGETRKLAVMERFLETVVIEAGCKSFRLDPLSAGVPIGYLWRKYNEVVNLRAILRGKAYGVPVNTIREELLLV